MHWKKLLLDKKIELTKGKKLHFYLAMILKEQFKAISFASWALEWISAKLKVKHTHTHTHTHTCTEREREREREKKSLKKCSGLFSQKVRWKYSEGKNRVYPDSWPPK